MQKAIGRAGRKALKRYNGRLVARRKRSRITLTYTENYSAPVGDVVNQWVKYLAGEHTPEPDSLLYDAPRAFQNAVEEHNKGLVTSRELSLGVNSPDQRP